MRDAALGQLSWGARSMPDGTWSFTLWAPGRDQIVLEL